MAAPAHTQTPARSWRAVSPTVWFLGLTSLLTDVSSEMITAILPAYTVLVLGVSPALFGVLDGVQQGGASLARLAAGLVTDSLGRYKEIALLGYLSSAMSRLGLLLAGASAPGMTAAMLVDRLGKGIRTAPRDALISMSAPADRVGTAFGVHRTLDTVGATLGPLVAFALLRLTGNDFPSVIVASLAIAVVGVAVIATFVRNPPGSMPPLPSLLSRDVVRGWLAVRNLRVLALIAGVLGLATLSDSMIYLVLQRRLQVPYGYLPIFYVATPAVYAVLATPCGWLSDRAGKGATLTAGYASLAAVYGLLLVPSAGWGLLPACLVLLGMHYAATDGVLAALASVVSPAPVRGTAIAAVGTALDAGRLLASLLFGFVWSALSAEWALRGFLLAIFVALLLVPASLIRLEREVRPS